MAICSSEPALQRECSLQGHGLELSNEQKQIGKARQKVLSNNLPRRIGKRRVDWFPSRNEKLVIKKKE